MYKPMKRRYSHKYNFPSDARLKAGIALIWTHCVIRMKPRYSYGDCAGIPTCKPCQEKQKAKTAQKVISRLVLRELFYQLLTTFLVVQMGDKH
jgi:hypothetical protein